MAVNYIFRDTSGSTDIVMVTDAPNVDIKFFTITELRGVESEEIEEGFIFIEGQENVEELELISVAQLNGWALEKWENGFIIDSNLAPILFGIFNGTTSNVRFDSLVSMPAEPTFELSMSIRLPDYGGSTIPSAQTIYATDIGDVASDYFRIYLNPNAPGAVTFGYTFFSSSSQVNSKTMTINPIDTDWHDIRVVYTDNGATVDAELFWDTQTSSLTGGGRADADSVSTNQILGYTGVGEYFPADIHNVQLTIDSTLEIDMIDPSTGVNSAGANGTVTDVTQGS